MLVNPEHSALLNIPMILNDIEHTEMSFCRSIFYWAY